MSCFWIVEGLQHEFQNGVLLDIEVVPVLKNALLAVDWAELAADEAELAVD
jgi:hypothetical protein